MRSFSLLLALAAVVAPPAPAGAQAVPAPDRAERVRYQNAVDGRTLFGRLILPPGEGPFPGVVVLTLAGTDALTDPLVERGWAVLVPERRGMGTPELLLEAGFQDLANDVQAGAAFLSARPEVDASVVGILGQGGETMASSLAAITPPAPAFVVLMSPTGLPGDASFRLEQRQLLQERESGPDAMAALDRYLARLGEIVLSDGSAERRALRIRTFMASSDVELPRNLAALPPDREGQIHFLSSRWWRDYFAFRPDSVLTRIRSPVLALMGEDDRFTPHEEHLPGIRSGLAAAPTDDVTVCLVGDRTQHTFTPVAVRVILDWLDQRLERGDGFGFVDRPRPALPTACLDDSRSRD